MKYAGDLTVNEVLVQMLNNNSVNCELTYTHKDMEFTLEVFITKIVKNGKVEFIAEVEE